MDLASASPCPVVLSVLCKESPGVLAHPGATGGDSEGLRSRDPFYFLTALYSLCALVCHGTPVDVRTTCRSGFSPYTTWALGIELRLTALVASTFTSEPPCLPWALCFDCSSSVPGK